MGRTLLLLHTTHTFLDTHNEQDFARSCVDDAKKVIEVEKEVAEMSKTIKDMLADLGGDAAVPLPNVAPDVLEKVMEYARHHHENPKPKEEQEADEEDKARAPQRPLRMGCCV